MADNQTMDKPINQCLTKEVKFIRVHVGPAKKCWTLNADLIRKQAPFFDRALGEDDESAEIWLKYEDEKSFAHVFDWIHCNALLRGDDLSVQAVKDSPISPWCKLHVLAAKLGVKDLATHALTMYLRVEQSLDENWIPNNTEILYGYTKLGPGTMFRRTIAHHMANCMFSTKFADWKSWARATSCCAEFNQDVAREMKEHIWNRTGDCNVEVCGVHEPLPNPSLDLADEDLPRTERAEDSVPAYELEVDRAGRRDAPVPSVE